MDNSKNLNTIFLETVDIEQNALDMLDEKLARKYMCIPIKILDKSTIYIAICDTLNLIALEDIKISTGMNPIAIHAEYEDIKKAIDRYYGYKNTISIAKELHNQSEIKIKKESIYNFETSDIDSSPSVKFVNSIIEQSVSKRATDIHIEPYSQYLRIRVRIDGQLQEMIRTDTLSINGIVARIKIMSKLDIAEHRKPQDGRIDMDIADSHLDLRINIVPTIYGEKVAIRIIYCSDNFISKNNIGFFEQDLQKFNRLLMNTSGIILVTGPTGSGKSTTLASAIRDMNTENINIVTVEDPVETKIDGINQINIDKKAGLDFQNILPYILRQDPDVIMIGEIRNSETATIAMRAAITGHLVLSTLHTNDSISSILRLIDMGVEPYMVAAAVKGIISQRLVRKLCTKCCQEIELSDSECDILKINRNTKVKKAVGCNYCNGTGYRGRFAVYEIFIIDEKIRYAISNKAEYEDIKNTAILNGMTSIYDNTLKNILNGNTTVEELYRVAYFQN